MWAGKLGDTVQYRWNLRDVCVIFREDNRREKEEPFRESGMLYSKKDQKSG